LELQAYGSLLLRGVIAVLPVFIPGGGVVLTLLSLGANELIGYLINEKIDNFGGSLTASTCSDAPNSFLPFCHPNREVEERSFCHLLPRLC
jgi:hypothetical protein